MDVDPEDQEVIRLLTKIKGAEAEYPEHMLVQRRRSYLRRMREVSLGIPADTAVREVAKDLKPSHISPATSTLVETALVIAIIAEASTVAYFYRHQLTDFIRRVVSEPGVQEVTPLPVVTSSFQIQSDVAIPPATIWSLPSPTGVAVTLTATPVPDVIPGVVESNSILNATATPGPNDSSLNNGNNGHHYGQTPKPERTKENGNNPPPKDKENKPPEEEKPPKEDNNQPAKDDNDIPPSDNSDKPPKN